ncbi:aldo/keto reductase [Nocardia heshunensis]
MGEMVKNRLGATDMQLSPLGFGAWSVAAGGWCYGWGAQDDAESIASIRYAVETGINWIDTAAVYGFGHSEHLVAKALAGFSDNDRPYVFTKCGLVWDEADPFAMPRAVTTPASVRRELEDSLRRLNLECIDLYQVQCPDTGRSPDAAGVEGTDAAVTPLAEYWALMAELVQEGKVSAIGLSNHSVAQLQAAEEIAHVDAIQPRFSLIHRAAANELAWAAAYGTGGIVYQPLHSGLLSGAFSADRVAALPEGDWRRTAVEFTAELHRNLALVEGLTSIAAAHGITVAAVAIAWTLSWTGVTGAIVGARRPDQIDAWIDAATVRLTDDDHHHIAELLIAEGIGAGPVLP